MKIITNKKILQGITVSRRKKSILKCKIKHLK